MTLRKTVLELYFQEKIKPVKNLLARNLALIAQESYASGKEWEELLPTISQACENAELDTRYRGVLLLSNVLGYCGSYMTDHFKSLGEFLYKMMDTEDTESKYVRAEALKGLSNIILSIDDGEVAKDYKVVF